MMAILRIKLNSELWNSCAWKVGIGSQALSFSSCHPLAEGRGEEDNSTLAAFFKKIAKVEIKSPL